jgi:hypothetical protein
MLSFSALIQPRRNPAANAGSAHPGARVRPAGSVMFGGEGAQKHESLRCAARLRYTFAPFCVCWIRRGSFRYGGDQSCVPL